MRLFLSAAAKSDELAGRQSLFSQQPRLVSAPFRPALGNDTIGGILTQMESCIPMALTTDSLEKFLLAKSPAEAEDFLESTKTDFLFLLLAAGKDDVLWQHILDVCENLRQKQFDKPKERRFCYGRKTLS